MAVTVAATAEGPWPSTTPTLSPTPTLILQWHVIYCPLSGPMSAAELARAIGLQREWEQVAMESLSDEDEDDVDM
ncbi:uncharacterized protein N7482_002137 [Penicillium canariense]|uniref:Uncharacterized protein n=1 Tax=Penicillium canariense TaxID=189055 RepID=A0A9W9II06_9EURO|nr:uncharacterized protein N7482_002137 [Penicillium canariense]KAJ5176260.1 hypothetical protein N7482_002137 [Penicillium canariense]